MFGIRILDLRIFNPIINQTLISESDQIVNNKIILNLYPLSQHHRIGLNRWAESGASFPCSVIQKLIMAHKSLSREPINKADQGTKADHSTNRTTENQNLVEAGKFSAGFSPLVQAGASFPCSVIQQPIKERRSRSCETINKADQGTKSRLARQ